MSREPFRRYTRRDQTSARDQNALRQRVEDMARDRPASGGGLHSADRAGAQVLVSDVPEPLWISIDAGPVSPGRYEAWTQLQDDGSGGWVEPGDALTGSASLPAYLPPGWPAPFPSDVCLAWPSADGSSLILLTPAALSGSPVHPIVNNYSYVTNNYGPSVVNNYSDTTINYNTSVVWNVNDTFVTNVYANWTININSTFVLIIQGGGVVHITNVTVNIDNVTINYNTSVVWNINQVFVTNIYANVTVNIDNTVTLQFIGGPVYIQYLIIGNTQINVDNYIWFDTSLHVLNVYYGGVVFQIGGTASNVPRWVKYTVGYADLADTATSTTITLASWPDKVVLQKAVMKTSAAFHFASGSNTLQLTLQDEVPNAILQVSDACQPIGNSMAQNSMGHVGAATDHAGPRFGAGHRFDLQAVSGMAGFDLADLDAGSIDIWLELSTLP